MGGAGILPVRPRAGRPYHPTTIVLFIHALALSAHGATLTARGKSRPLHYFCHGLLMAEDERDADIDHVFDKIADRLDERVHR